MKKIIVIGSPGSGKSTLSKRLAKKYELPLVHLDRLFWKSGWMESSRDEFDAKLAQALEQDSWIIDGHYGRTLPMRLQKADTVIFLDYPKYICLLRVLKRVLKNFGGTRSDKGNDCPERFDTEFLRYVWNFQKNNRPKILALLSEAENKRIIVIHSNKELKHFLEV